MEISDRVKELRKTLNLSQEAFGNKLGITKASVSRIENGVFNLTSQLSKLICKEFNVDYFWLTEGTGEMFTKVPETLLDKLASQYNLSDKGRIILKTYLNAPEDQQDALENFLLTLAENMKKRERLMLSF